MSIKEVEKEEVKHKLVEIGVRKYKIYVTDDGMEFTSQREAKKWEKGLLITAKWKAIKHFKLDFSELGDDWYCPKDEEEIKMLKATLLNYADKEEVRKVQVGKWFNYYRFDGGDYPDSYRVTLLEEVLEQFKELKESTKC
jgi:hypothetical protein